MSETTAIEFEQLAVQYLNIPARVLGRRHGLVRCPFHNDSTPSLSIDLDKGLWYCFGCQKGGNGAQLVEALAEARLLNGAPPSEVVVRPSPERQTSPITFADLYKQFHELCRYSTAETNRHLSEILGVSEYAIQQMPVGWWPYKTAWAFPMRTAGGQLCGIKLRYLDGAKLCLEGSKLGLFYSMYVSPRNTVLFVTEGESDTLTVLSLGFVAVGLPSASFGFEQLAQYVSLHRPSAVVIIADNDHAGQQAAQKAMEAVNGGIPKAVWTPPCKDIREFVNRTDATASVLRSVARSLLGPHVTATLYCNATS